MLAFKSLNTLKRQATEKSDMKNKTTPANDEESNTFFADANQIDITQFAAYCEQETLSDAYPLALDIQKKVPIYHGKHLRLFMESQTLTLKCKAEFAKALKDGPGVLVIKNAYDHLSCVDDMSDIFNTVFADEAEQTLAGDHFAEAGSNGRIWNVFEKSSRKVPSVFTNYYKNPILNLISESWLGPHYQITAQVNVVHPGGKSQSPHRDYHLGFQDNQEVSRYPVHIQLSSRYLTLQGAIAHTDMPLESGPTRLLPFSQHYPLGYMAWRDKAFKDYFEAHAIQLPLEKGDAIFFNPALFHAAGTNMTSDHSRVANLLQISSCFGKPMETVNLYNISKALYPYLLTQWQSGLMALEKSALLSAICDGYSFPSNLDTDSPIGGMAPLTHAQLTKEALDNAWPLSDYSHAIEQHRIKRES